MARVAGIKFEKNDKGDNRFVRIDLKKYGTDIQPFLEKVGAIEHDDFEEQWTNALTIEEANKISHDFIMSLDWSKKSGENEGEIQ